MQQNVRAKSASSSARTLRSIRRSSTIKPTSVNFPSSTSSGQAAGMKGQAQGAEALHRFRGADGAGKGGVIKAITARVSPRIFAVVACRRRPIAKNRRCICSANLAISRRRARSSIFDRSWYNRAGVERVMGFCTEEQTRHSLKTCRRWRRRSSSRDILPQILARGQRRGADAPA